jgi:hypothetical protein
MGLRDILTVFSLRWDDTIIYWSFVGCIQFSNLSSFHFLKHHLFFSTNISDAPSRLDYQLSRLPRCSKIEAGQRLTVLFTMMKSKLKDLSNLGGASTREKRSKHHPIKLKSHKGGYQTAEISKPAPIQHLPRIVNSVTEDEEDRQARYAPPSNKGPYIGYTPKASDARIGRGQESVSFLRHYDAMLRQQEVEYEATLSHLRPLLHNLVVLARAEDDDDQQRGSLTPYYKADDEDENCLLRDFTFEELKRALTTLEHAPSSYKFMAEDRQFLLTLSMLTEKVDLADPATCAAEDRITWIEIMQCYRICVLAMQTLEKIPEPKDIRARARGRGLSMMSLFVPVSTQDASSETSVVGEEIFERDHKLGEREGGYRLTSRSESVGLFFFLITMIFLLFGLWQPSQKVLVHPIDVRNASADMSPTAPFQPINQTGNFDCPLSSTPPVQPLLMPPRRLSYGKVYHIPAAPHQKYLKQDIYRSQQQQQRPPLKNTFRNVLVASGLPRNAFSGDLSSAGVDTKNTVGVRASTVAGSVAAGFLVPIAAKATMTISTSIVPLLSIGGTVIVATLVAHSLQALIVRWHASFRRWVQLKAAEE